MNLKHTIEKNYNLYTIGEQLLKLRKYFRLSQKEIGKMVTVSNQYYGYLEKGRKTISLKLLIRLTQLFKIDINYFLLPGANVEEFIFSQVNHQLKLFKGSVQKQLNNEMTKNNLTDNNSILFHNSFLNTSVCEDVARYLNEFLKSTNRIIVFYTPHKNGITSAIKKYLFNHNLKFLYIDNALLLNEHFHQPQSSFGQHSYKNFQIAVFENIETLIPEDVNEIVKTLRRNDFYIIITSKQKHFFLKNFTKLPFVAEDIYPLTVDDMLLFFKYVLPDFLIPEKLTYRIEDIIKGNITYLLSFIQIVSMKKLNFQESLEISFDRYHQ